MDVKIFLAGSFIGTEQKVVVVNPFDGSIAGTTYLAGDAEFEKAVEAALSAREPLRQMPAYSRYEALMKIRQSLIDQREAFALTIVRESAKPLRYALAEVDRSIQTFTVAAEETKRLPREYLALDWTAAGQGREGRVKYFPIGVVAGISPFNFPLNLAVHKIAPALAAGCPIILKPSTSTPLSTLKLAGLIAETKFPAGAVSILPMSRTTGNKLVTDSRISLLSFTGSPEVGWAMKAAAGKKKTLLELGGNAGVIVTPTSDVELAVKRCLTGAFSYSGQVCIHTQRIYVHQSVFRQFSELFSEGVARLKHGNPELPETEISVMIDQENAIRVEKWISEAVEDGAHLVCGGKRQGKYIEPTVLTGTTANMRVCSDEVFGPVVTLEPYDSFNEAVSLLNQSRFGLQAGVFTDSLNEMESAFEQLQVGGVIINDVPTFRVDHMPYGGIKDSGLGREGVKYAIMEMMEPRILVR